LKILRVALIDAKKNLFWVVGKAATADVLLRIRLPLWQCRINNSSKFNNCYGPRASGGPAVFCVKFVFYCMMDITKIQGGYSNLGVRGKFSGSSPYILHMLYRNFIRWKQVKILIFLGIRFCV